MAHNFKLNDPYLGKNKRRTLNLKGFSYVPDMGFRKLYACNSCHNLQTQLPTCMICYQDDTLLALSQVTDIISPGTETTS